MSETYYDKQLTFELSRVHPNYYRTNKGGIVVADIAYITGNGPSAYRPVAYFIDMAGDSVTRRDTSLMPHCDFSGLMQWENDDVIMSFRNQNTGYDYVVYTYAGDEKLAFGSNENLFERNSNQYCLSERDFVTYRVESYQIYASRQVVKSGRLEKKWERWISLPDELNNARVKAYPKVADGKITFDVVAMLRNGETRKLRYLFDLETGNNF